MISSLCAVCNKPVWSFVHSPNHPANIGNEDITHDFMVPGKNTPVPEVETYSILSEKSFKHTLQDVGIMVLFFIGVFAIHVFIESVHL